MKSTDAKLKALKVLFLDADGVFFTGHETRKVKNDLVEISKTRWFPDGQGISFLRELGLKIVFISGEGEPLQSLVDKFNNLPSVQSGKWFPIDIFTKKIYKGAKSDTIRTWLAENSFSPADCAYMGDDLNDREAMKMIKDGGGLAIVPSNVQRALLDLAEITTKKAGGAGAIREFAEMVLDARGVDEKTLPPA